MSNIQSGYSPPSLRTQGEVGDIYVDRRSGAAYRCTSVSPCIPLDYGFVDIHQGPNRRHEWVGMSEYVATDLSYYCAFGHRLDEVGRLDTSKVTNFAFMFYSKPISSTPDEDIPITEVPLFDTSRGVNFRGMFSGCSALTQVPLFNTSSGTNFRGMFNECPALTQVPAFDTSNGITFDYMLGSCSSLTQAPVFDTSNGITFEYMFNGCSALTQAPLLDTSRGTNFRGMFNGCAALTQVPSLDTSEGTNFTGMFKGCSRLTSAPAFNTSHGVTLDQMFSGCSELVTVEGVDLNMCLEGAKNIFYNCSQLTNLCLFNIRSSIALASGTSWGHLLTVGSLVQAIKELCGVTTSQTLTISAPNLEKIANLYCRVIDDTTEKIEMELCESTDEGAMTLREYAALKNWAIQ